MKNKHFIILFIFYFLLLCQVFSQKKPTDFQAYLDSAKNVSNQDSSIYFFNKALNASQSETQKATILFMKGKMLFDYTSYNDSRNVFYDLIYLKNKNLDSLKVKSYFMLGSNFINLGKNDSTQWAFSEARRIAEKPRDSRTLAMIENNLGFMAETHSDFEKALKHYTKTAELCREVADSAIWAHALYNIGYINQELGELETTHKYLEQALIIAPKNSSFDKQVAIHLGFADYYLELNQADSALNHILKGDSIIKTHNLIGFTDYIDSYLGDIYFQKNNYTKSAFFYKKILLSYQKSDDKLGIIETGLNLAKIYYQIEQSSKGVNICREMLEKVDVFESKHLKKELLEVYSQILKQSGNYKEAVKILEEAYRIEKELWSTEKTKSLAELQTKYETEKKERKIEKLSQEKEQRAVVTGGIIIVFSLIILVLTFFFRQKRLQSQYLALDSEQKFLRTQMNPHFIFNALTAIQFYVLKNEAQKSVFYIATFAKLMRQVLNNSQENFVSLEEEIDTLKNYLELQKVRFQDKFDYQIEIDPDLEIDELGIPPMFAQPFIENSLEHGIKHKEEKGNIKIRFYQKDKKYLVFEVEDDGIGLDKSQLINVQNEVKHQSMATQITKNRIGLLNKRFNLKVKFNISPIKSEKNNEQIGTKVWFLLPFKYL